MQVCCIRDIPPKIFWAESWHQDSVIRQHQGKAGLCPMGVGDEPKVTPFICDRVWVQEA